MACSCCGEGRGPGSVTLLHRSDIEICSGCLDWLQAKRRKRVAATDAAVAVVGTEPIFSVNDVARARDHYERLGFSTSEHDGSYAFAHRGELTIHLAHADPPARPGGGAVYLHVDDAQQLAADWRKAGIEVDGPRDEDYGKTEGSHRDPDGNLIRFGSPRRDRGTD